VARLEIWHDREVERLTKKGQEQRIQSVEDKRDTIQAFIASSGAGTVIELKEHITALFETTNGVVTLCTVHKAKGLEAERVFLLNIGMMPSPWARSAHALKQESNLEYVAITRAKSVLCEIGGDGLHTPQEVAAMLAAQEERDQDRLAELPNQEKTSC
jgi:superfamily I DNA/RNA helicase